MKINYSFLLRLLGFRIGQNTKLYTVFIDRNTMIGNNVMIQKKVEIWNENVIENDVIIGQYSILAGNVYLKNNTKVGSYSYLKHLEIDERSQIESGVITLGFGHGKIKIGKESYIGLRCVLDYSDNIYIGDFVHIAGPSTGLWTHSSVKQALYGDRLEDKTRRITAPIFIENNVYIGGNSTIYPGIKIGHHSIIAPNSAVTKDVEPYSLVGGVPARLIKRIDLV